MNRSLEYLEDAAKILIEEDNIMDGAKYLKECQRWVVKRCDGIGLTDGGSLEFMIYLMEHCTNKARFFQHFGFSPDNWSALAEALRQHGLENKIVNAVESPFGCRYIVEGKIMSPDGRNPSVRTVWIVEKGESAPRLITAHPA